MEAPFVQRQFHQRRIGDERILGDSAFVERIRKEQELRLFTQTERIRQGWNMEVLFRYVCTMCTIEFVEILLKARNNRRSLAKALFCYWGTKELGLTCRHLAHRLLISQPAASKWVGKGENYSQERLLGLPDRPE